MAFIYVEDVGLGYGYWAALAVAVGTGATSDTGMTLADPATPLTFAGIDNADSHQSAVQGQMYVAFLPVTLGDPAPSLHPLLEFVADTPDYIVIHTPKGLSRLGFNDDLSVLLQTDPTTTPLRTLVQTGLSIRQAKTLHRGDRSVRALVRGGFPPVQARALTDE